MSTPATASELQRTMADAGAVFAPDGSVRHFGNPEAEFVACWNSTGLVDRTGASRMRHTGPDALDLLHRITTNDLASLAPGGAAGTVLTSEQGRVVDVMAVAVQAADRLLLLSEAPDARAATGWIDRYTIIEDALITDVSAATAQFTIVGPRAPGMVESLAGQAAGDDAAFSFEVSGVAVEAVRLDGPGTPRIDLICGVEDGPAVWLAMAAAGAVPCGTDAFHTARVVSGTPFPGFDLSGRVNPLEAGLERLVSFTKGCYIGQEVIARLDSYDKLRRRLVGLVSDRVLAPGAELTAGGRRAGEVTTVAPLRPWGRALALGYARRGAWEPGTGLECGGDAVTVVSLPVQAGQATRS